MINRFKPKAISPKYIQETIINSTKDVVGVIRIKPSGVLWKPKGQMLFYKVDLADFIAWITNPKTKADRVAN